MVFLLTPTSVCSVYKMKDAEMMKWTEKILNSENMPIDLYMFLPSPPSRAVLVTAKHLGVSVNVKNVNLLSGENKTVEFSKVLFVTIVKDIQNLTF